MLLNRLVVLCAAALFASGCPAPSTGPPPAQPAYPQAPTVSADDLAQILPKDQNGKPILLEVGGVPLTVEAPHKDAIGAAAKCTDLVTSCAEATDRSKIELCIRDVPRCTTSEPWNEGACCPSACVTAYDEERRLGATRIAAFSAVFGSTHECFPGLQELIRANGGTPRRMPRLAP